MMSRCAPGCDVKRNPLCRYYFNWSLAMLLGMYSIIGYIMPIPSLLAFVTTSTDTPCGPPGLGDTETVYSVASGMFNGGSMIGAIVVAILTRRISYKAIMLIGPVLQVLGYCIYGLSVAGWMVVIGRGFAGFNYGASLAASMSYYSVSSTEYNEVAVSLSKPEKRNIRKTLMIAHFSVAGIGYVISTGLVAIVERIFEYPQVNTFRWIAWFNIATGCLAIALQLLLFHGTDNCFQCVKKPEAPNEEDYKEVNTKLSDIFIIVYILFAGAVIDTTLIIVDTIGAILLTDYFGFTVEYISYCFLGIAQMYHIPAWILILLDKCKIKSMVVLFMSLVLASVACLILVDWPNLYSYDNCEDYSIDEPVQLATSSENMCDISSFCYPLDIPQYHNISLYIIPNNNDNVMYTVTHEHVCRDNASNITGANPYCINCTTNILCTNIYDNTCIFNNSDCTNITLYGTDTNIDNNNTCENEYEDILVGIKYIDNIAEKQAHCKQHGNCYWNSDSSITEEYCYSCPTLCRIKDSLHFSQLIIALAIFLYAAESGRNMLFPIMSKLSPKHIRPITTSILIFVQDLSRLITPLWAVEIYLSTGRHTYPMAGTVIALQLPVYVGFFVLNFYLHSKKSRKKELHKPRPSIVELIPSENDQSTHIEGTINQVAIESNSALPDEGEESIFFPFFVTPL